MASPNPFAPPAELAPPPRSTAGVPLFGPRAIAAHAVLLTPLAGSVLAALNHRRRGDGVAFRRTLLAYVAPSAVLLALLLAAGESAAGALRMASLVWSVTLARILYAEHKVIFRKHIEAGGPPARWYLATLCCLGVLVIYAVIAEVMDPVARVSAS